jgi:hypothetical protein
VSPAHDIGGVSAPVATAQHLPVTGEQERQFGEGSLPRQARPAASRQWLAHLAPGRSGGVSPPEFFSPSRTSQSLATRRREPGEECEFEVAPGVMMAEFETPAQCGLH